MADETATVLLCNICSDSIAKYTCPRCNVRYCSVDCYKSRSHLECSELFYQKCVMESLGATSAGDDQRLRMAEMLKNFERERCDDDEPPDLAERLSGIDLDGDPEKVLGVLTPEELKQFEAVLEDESLRSDIVELWDPWWCKQQHRMVEELSETTPTQIPLLLKDTEDLSRLLKTKTPSDSIAYGIINTLYGYAFVTRLYNGNHINMSLESCDSLLDISMSLNNEQFQDVATALGSCISCLRNSDQNLFISQEHSIAVIEDVVKILKGPNASSPLLYTLAALSDCQRLFQSSYKMLKNEKKSPESQKKLRMFYGVRKKLEFYISWVKSCGTLLQKLVPMVELEFCSLSSDFLHMKTEREQIETLLKQGKAKQDTHLIEEI